MQPEGVYMLCVDTCAIGIRRVTVSTIHNSVMDAAIDSAAAVAFTVCRRRLCTHARRRSVELDNGCIGETRQSGRGIAQRLG